MDHRVSCYLLILFGLQPTLTMAVERGAQPSWKSTTCAPASASTLASRFLLDHAIVPDAALLHGTQPAAAVLRTVHTTLLAPGPQFAVSVSLYRAVYDQGQPSYYHARPHPWRQACATTYLI